ncbi:hypothetical protein [Rhodococcus sp. (in: high G+C Gram-positive bacteria)]|uniref:hypothetical protein n=1 Tax=Rhodococcus sp. TaxID=1831 RepID=UPI00258083DF|nr:hypothetical protein [Rhodococcus sp. (in: high G+C Gram-positive bacteria)]MBQ9051725.1 hypothetical protein [Rhodococcus sp. (in: high G+C Gram-positive bacteria)]
MSTVRIYVTSPLGDIEVSQEGPTRYGCGSSSNREQINALLERAAHMVRTVYEIQEKPGSCAAKFDDDHVYRCALADGHHGDHTTVTGEHWQKSSFSPVVPAPAETEWPTWDAVPENVTVISSFLDHRYRKVDGEVFRVLEDGKRHKVADFTPTDMRSFAPFAAAKEG